jgi:hypothetical protein
MIILYIILSLILLVIIVFAGTKMSEGINHPTLLIFFWIIYLATVLTIGNGVSTVFFYGVLRTKRGIPGESGRVGDKGAVGLPGVCDSMCDRKACTISITDKINETYAKLVKPYRNTDTDKPIIRNREFMDNIKTICSSDAYQQVIKYKSAMIINNYISSIYIKWLKLLFKSDKSSNKDLIITYLETDGLEDKPKLDGNPFEEIEKYDIYYWGRNMVFHPRVIQYCNKPEINKNTPQKYPPIIKGIRTNIYNPLMVNGRFKRRKGCCRWRRSDWLSIYRVNPYTFEGVVYYPLGDYFTNWSNANPTGKFVETFGIDNPKRLNFANNSLLGGPNDPQLLLAADDNYLRPPYEWDLIWYSSRRWSNRTLSIWKPRDYYDRTLNKWFRGCGYFSNLNHRFQSPRDLYGYNTPERQPIRLVSEELLIPFSTGNLEYRWYDEYSNASVDMSIWMAKDTEYKNTINLSAVVIGWDAPPSIQYYKIKTDPFKERPVGEVEFKHPLTDKYEYGIGYLGAPNRDEKYSVFSFLNIPLEVQLVNAGNADKIYVKHSGANTVNSYLIRRLNLGDKELEYAFRRSNSENDDTVLTNVKYNTSDGNQLWELVCVDDNYNISSNCNGFKYLLKSPDKDVYLSSMLNDTTTNNYIYTSKPLPAKGGNYKLSMSQFVWFKPSSATGNQLLKEKPTTSEDDE